jgi:hypothetical protein
MVGLVCKIPVWRNDSACAKGVGEDIFLSFFKSTENHSIELHESHTMATI